ncbi:MAG: YdbL family protein [Methylomonas sp.]|nr:YdbL family protein [Methylomonas sp.]PPD19801.1 MAG: hypothetical protein CTY23_10840 [Methylomonas sp.]PPD25792.1 MAG: hypothetical protein CTY22_07385 [Methylomonas sp.]PPD36960.1 MAG: hypothetical protein CTY17_11035 [Methylomonas sp.]PPD37256.1 MAG: hypothetical protein CTY21_07385 [Methylomonas sp.]
MKTSLLTVACLAWATMGLQACSSSDVRPQAAEIPAAMNTTIEPGIRRSIEHDINDLISSFPAAAFDLVQAKAQGLVGEQMDGFLGVVSVDTPVEIRAMVVRINAQRQAEYQRIAVRNGVTVGDVAQLAGQRMHNIAAPGHFIKTPDDWQQR